MHSLPNIVRTKAEVKADYSVVVTLARRLLRQENKGFHLWT